MSLLARVSLLALLALLLLRGAFCEDDATWYFASLYLLASPDADGDADAVEVGFEVDRAAADGDTGTGE